MRMRVFLFTILSGLLQVSLAAEPLRVVTTTTDLAWVVKEIAGDRASVESLLSGSEDAHYLDALPKFISQVANADVLCFNGLALESGWLPKVLARSGNSKVQRGGLGYCDASKSVSVIEKLDPGTVDRSMGHVHPEGNPHYSLSPTHLAQAAQSVKASLMSVDIDSAQVYEDNYQRLKQQLNRIFKKTKKVFEQVGHPLRVMQYHTEFSYFVKAYGHKDLGALEKFPGVSPSAARLAEVSIKAKQNKVDVVLAANHAKKDLVERFSEISGVSSVILPVYIQKSGPLSSYEDLQLRLARQMVAAAGTSGERKP